MEGRPRTSAMFARSLAIGGLVSLLMAAASPSFAQAKSFTPQNRFGLKFEQKIGTKLPLDAKFLDENGKAVTLGDFFGQRPVVLTFVFYACKGTCLLVRDGVVKTLNAQKKLKAGQDFDVVVISIQHTETPDLARAKKAYWLQDYKVEGTEAAWHFLTGSESEIRKVTDAAGFAFYIDPNSDNIAHPAGMIVCTPDGRTSEYLIGVTYPQFEVRNAILRAKENQLGVETPAIYLGCFVMDPKTGQYRPVVERILQVLGSATAIILALSIVTMAIKNRNRASLPPAQEGPRP